jgi:hypothetical protein
VWKEQVWPDGYKSTARDLGAFICFEEEAGQGLRPPKGRTWAPRGARPVVTVRGAGGGRVSIAGVACFRPRDRPHLYYQLRVHRRRKGEPKGRASGHCSSGPWPTSPPRTRRPGPHHQAQAEEDPVPPHLTTAAWPPPA